MNKKLKREKAYNEYSRLTLANDFIFAKVMMNEKLCKKLLEVILGIKIERIEYVETQKTIFHIIKSRSVRLDVYVKDSEKTVYNIEMQTTNTRNLPKRSRYYQGMIDLNLLKKGKDYKQLNKSYVIFICTFDVFNKGRHIYTFENYCEQDKELCLNDEATKIFLNPYSDMEDIDEELNNFLRYLADGKPVDDFTRELDQEVTIVRENRKWRLAYMTMALKMDDVKQTALGYGIMGMLNLEKKHNPHITLDDFYNFVSQQKGYENISKEIVEEIFYE